MGTNGTKVSTQGIYSDQLNSKFSLSDYPAPRRNDSHTQRAAVQCLRKTLNFTNPSLNVDHVWIKEDKAAVLAALADPAEAPATVCIHNA